MAKIKFTLDDINNASKTIKAKAGEFTEEYKEIIKLANDSDSYYHTEDSKVFVEKVNGLSTSMKFMVEKLEQLSKVLETEAKNYKERIDANKKSASNLPN